MDMAKSLKEGRGEVSIIILELLRKKQFNVTLFFLATVVLLRPTTMGEQRDILAGNIRIVKLSVTTLY